MTKTVIIDVDAYERLGRAGRSDESLSETIRRLFPRRRTFEEVSRLLAGKGLSEETLDAIEDSVKRRRRTSQRYGE